MPSRTRIHFDGLALHIVQRGHNRAACFFDDQDRRAYLGWLHEALVRERCRLHADVLSCRWNKPTLAPCLLPTATRLG
jgi:putative transposase